MALSNIEPHLVMHDVEILALCVSRVTYKYSKIRGYNYIKQVIRCDVHIIPDGLKKLTCDGLN